jgi:hypothetical protein
MLAGVASLKESIKGWVRNESAVYYQYTYIKENKCIALSISTLLICDLQL